MTFLRLPARGRRPLALTVALLAGMLVIPAAASAATCTYSATAPTTATVTIPSAGISTIGRSVAGAITVDGVACPTATVTNTDVLKIVGAAGAFSQEATLSLANGPMSPGKTAETGVGNLSEIEVQVQLGAGYDTFNLVGSAGNNVYTMGALGTNLNNDTDGDDVVRSGIDSSLEVKGMAGTDLISGAGGLGTGSPIGKALALLGGSGNDTLTGGRGYDQLWGDADEPYGDPVAAGNDTLRGGDGGDSLEGQTGNDTMEGQAGGDNLALDLGSDIMRGGDGYDSFDDNLYTGAPDGADLISGGRNDDSLDLSNRSQALVITLDNVVSPTVGLKGNDGADTNVPTDGIANEGDDIQADVEDIYLGDGPDRANADFPPANAAAASNTFYGGIGNDILRGGEGVDYLSGDDGNDQLFGGAGDDDLNGYDDNDQLFAGDGDDYADGGLGSDTVNGEAGDDYMGQESSSDGADFISGGVGFDTAYYGSRSSNTRIILDNVVSPTPGLKGNDGADVDLNGTAEEGDDVRADVEEVYTGSGNDLINAATTAANLVGADNLFDGYNGNDQLFGGNGDDTLEGGSGADQLTGGVGEDDMFGEAGVDRFTALDGYFDSIDGGFDADTDVVVSKDAFDSVVRVP